jgi:hypothetical protein
MASSSELPMGRSSAAMAFTRMYSAANCESPPPVRCTTTVIRRRSWTNWR